MNKNTIAILSKVPTPGLSKTRLSPPYTLKECALLAHAFLKDTVKATVKVKGADIFVFYAPSTMKMMFKDISTKVAVKNVQGGSLGEKSVYIFNTLFKKGYKNVILIPSDCPDMPKEYMQQPFKILLKDNNAIIIGPSSDGALNLIAANACNQGVLIKHLSGIDWSPDFSLKAVTDKFKKSGIPVYWLPKWHDIDTYSDIIGFIKRNGRTKTFTGSLINKFAAYPNFSKTIMPFRA